MTAWHIGKWLKVRASAINVVHADLVTTLHTVTLFILTLIEVLAFLNAIEIPERKTRSWEYLDEVQVNFHTNPLVDKSDLLPTVVGISMFERLRFGKYHI